MREVIRNGATVLFVSHNMGLVAEFCSRALLLDAGQVLTVGPTSDVISYYMNRLHQRRITEQRGPVVISNVSVRDERDEAGPRDRFTSGEKAWIDIEVSVHQPCSNSAVAVSGSFCCGGPRRGPTRRAVAVTRARVRADVTVWSAITAASLRDVLIAQGLQTARVAKARVRWVLDVRWRLRNNVLEGAQALAMIAVLKPAADYLSAGSARAIAGLIGVIRDISPLGSRFIRPLMKRAFHLSDECAARTARRSLATRVL